MEKEFIPYEEALSLKELGFDESCLGAYYNKIDEVSYGLGPYGFNQVMQNKFPDIILAPLYQQAFKWFREKYNLEGYMFPKRVNKETKWKYQTLFFEEVSANHLPMQLEPSKCFKTYEEAELELLKKLIEIVKNEKK